MVVLAQDEARALKHNYIGTEHILLGLLRPPLAPEFVAELERVRANKEEALATIDFERAASLRDRERELGRAARQLEHVWEGRPDAEQQFGYAPISHTRAVPIRTVTAWVPMAAVFAGWMLFGAALGIGLVVGWLIWG